MDGWMGGLINPSIHPSTFNATYWSIMPSKSLFPRGNKLCDDLMGCSEVGAEAMLVAEDEETL